MQATLTIPAKTPSSIDVASKGQKLPSLLSTFSLVRRGGDLFRAGATSKSPLSTTTLAAASPLATSPSSQSTFVLLDALTLKLRSNLAGVRVGNVSDDRASQVSIDVELEDDEQEQEIEDIQKLLQETVIEGQQVRIKTIAGLHSPDRRFLTGFFALFWLLETTSRPLVILTAVNPRPLGPRRTRGTAPIS